MVSRSLESKDAATTTTPLLPPPSSSGSEVCSALDGASSTAVGSESHTAFRPGASLQIQAAGKPALSPPWAPPSQLAIPILSAATGRPAYASVRPQRRKGSCQLVRAGGPDGGRVVARTTYRFGPGRRPVVRIGSGDGDDDDDDDDGVGDGVGVEEEEEFEMVRASLLGRAVGFETRRWGRFEWRYGSRSERAQAAGAAGADNLLVLERVRSSSGGSGSGGRGEAAEERRVRVAQLVRNEAWRTPGTSSCTAGNGGRLQMDLLDEKGREVVDEVVVVATCLVMLKKEIDRLRCMQMVALSAAGGS